jgi:hypothetical protein
MEMHRGGRRVNYGWIPTFVQLGVRFVYPLGGQGDMMVHLTRRNQE